MPLFGTVRCAVPLGGATVHGATGWRGSGPRPPGVARCRMLCVVCDRHVAPPLGTRLSGGRGAAAQHTIPVHIFLINTPSSFAIMGHRDAPVWRLMHAGGETSQTMGMSLYMHHRTAGDTGEGCVRGGVTC